MSPFFYFKQRKSRATQSKEERKAKKEEGEEGAFTLIDVTGEAKKVS